MKVIKKNEKEIYKYLKHEFTDGMKVSIVFFVLCILFLFVGVLISYLSGGDAGTIVGGFAISSIICDISSLIYVIIEIYHKKFYPEVRNMLLITVAYLIMWILIV